MNDYWYVVHLNTEPWAIGPLGVGKKNGKFFPYIGANAQLVGFQEAVKDELKDVSPLPDGEYRLTFYIWRALDTYESVKKSVKKNMVDATNMQKGLEDALQGVLFDNDRKVRDIRTVIVEQSADTRPFIIIRADLWPGLDPDEVPEHVWQKTETPEERELQTHLWGDDEPELF